MTRTHLRLGTSDADWIQRSLDAAQSDPVGLWQMVKVGRDGFGLSGAALEDFVRQFIQTMVAGGAEPVVGDKAAPSGWSRTARYGTSPADIASALVAGWKASGVDPDVGGVWFAQPSVHK